MTHYIDLSTKQLRLLYASISSGSMELEEMREIMEKLERHLSVPGSGSMIDVCLRDTNEHGVEPY